MSNLYLNIIKVKLLSAIDFNKEETVSGIFK
jgi:hypothetical protein